MCIKKKHCYKYTQRRSLAAAKKRYFPGSRGSDILCYFDRVRVKSFRRGRSIVYFILL